MAGYANKILRSAIPAGLPIASALRHELVINLRTAREIGVAVPAELLGRATLVIE
jgi:putative ABC transport system substrate-binding protein